MRLVIVDIDGTLYAGSSTEKRFYLHLLKTGNQGPRQLAAYLAFLLRWFPAYGRDVFRKNKAYLAGLRAEKIRRLASEWVRSRPDDAWFGPCLERIRRYQRDGDLVVLVSGTPDFIASAIATHLGLDGAIGTRCAMRGGRFRLRPPVRHPFAAEKVRIARELRETHAVRKDGVVALGDSRHDLPLLREADVAIAVCPDERLAAAATEHGWEILGRRRKTGLARLGESPASR